MSRRNQLTPLTISWWKTSFPNCGPILCVLHCVYKENDFYTGLPEYQLDLQNWSSNIMVTHPLIYFGFSFSFFFFFRKYSSFPVARLTTIPIVNNPIFNSGVHRFSISSTLKRKKSSTMSSFLQHWCEYYNALTKRNRFPQQRLTFWKRIQNGCEKLLVQAWYWGQVFNIWAAQRFWVSEASSP